MSVYVSNVDRRLGSVITPKRLQRAWEKGYVCVVYDRVTQRVVMRVKDPQKALRRRALCDTYGIIFLCNQKNNS